MIDLHPGYPGALVPRLEHLCSTIVRLTSALGDLIRDLADHGIVSPTMPPTVNGRDGLAVVRLKERARAIWKDREQAEKTLSSLGATLVDPATMELALPGGPEEGSFLSWQPGEPEISWWRASADPRCGRFPLAALDDAGKRPSLH